MTGTVAIGTVSLPQTAAAAIAPKDRPPMAALAARVRMRPDGSAAIALASAQMREGLEVIWQPGASHEDSGSPNRVASPWACRQQAYDTARAVAGHRRAVLGCRARRVPGGRGPDHPSAERPRGRLRHLDRIRLAHLGADGLRADAARFVSDWLK